MPLALYVRRCWATAVRHQSHVILGPSLSVSLALACSTRLFGVQLLGPITVLISSYRFDSFRSLLLYRFSSYQSQPSGYLSVLL